jgi:hypothetical protein
MVAFALILGKQSTEREMHRLGVGWAMQIGGTQMRIFAVILALFLVIPATHASAAIGVAKLVVPANAPGGPDAIGSFKLDDFAPLGGKVVTLTSSNTAVATVPASVTVNAGLKAKSFTISTQVVTVATAVTIKATLGTSQKTAVITLQPPALAKLQVTPTKIGGGAPVTGKVYMSAPALAGGAVITLTSNNTNAATVPASVTIPAGEVFTTFTVTTKQVTASTPVTLKATRGTVIKTAVLTVAPATVAGVSVDSPIAYGGNPVTGTVTLTGPAPTGGRVVNLSSNNTNAATVPANVTVVAGASTATFPVTPKAQTQSTRVTLSASYSGVTKTTYLTVKPPVLATVTFPVDEVVGPSPVTGTVELTGLAPTGGITVFLSVNVAPAIASVPASVLVPAGARTVTFTLTTQAVTTTKVVRTTAVYAGSSKFAIISVTPEGGGGGALSADEPGGNGKGKHDGNGHGKGKVHGKGKGKGHGGARGDHAKGGGHQGGKHHGKGQKNEPTDSTGEGSAPADEPGDEKPAAETA